MANTLVRLGYELLPSASTPISFSNISQSYTDLMVIFSGRSAYTSGADAVLMGINGVGTNFTQQLFEMTGTSTNAQRSAGAYPAVTWGNHSANMFASFQIYIPNYTSSLKKQIIIEGVSENSANTSYGYLRALLWDNTSAINALSFSNGSSGFNWVAGTSIGIYGIKNT